MPTDKKKYLSGNLDQIALSLSGGGVRAVGFHLGTMSMLRRLGLLHNVQILSTVSGGSMPGIGYSLAQQFGRSFQDFFDDFYEFLPELNILEKLLDGVTQRYPPTPSGRRDLITAMADVYDECYFSRFFSPYVKDGRLLFDVLMNGTGRGHLQEMIFNATEFKTGTAFRFQVSEFRCLIGNGNISICRKHAAQIRIADIMAASSCIPVGMEPLFFPDDFHWPDDGKSRRWGSRPSRPTNDEIRAALRRNTDTKEPTFALMDGGVYDNQGITSTLLALNRRKENYREQDTHECGVSMSSLGRSEPPGPEDWAKWMSGRVSSGSAYKSVGVKPEDLDLLIISDTPVRKASFYPRILFPSGAENNQPEADSREEAPKRGLLQRLGHWAKYRITLGMITFITTLLLIALSISLGIALVELWAFWDARSDEVPFGKGFFITFHVALPFLLLVQIWWLLWQYRKLRKELALKLQSLISHWDRKPKRYLKKLTVGDVIDMGLLRASSTAALTSAIYMDRIRGLGYSTAFSREDLQDKILANEIFALQKARQLDDPFIHELRAQEAWPPPPEMDRIVDIAANMQTKLWIDHEKDGPHNDLDFLVVCGQSTICYNLMRYLWEDLRNEDGSWLDPKMQGVFEHALREWKKLMDDPWSLLNDRKRKSRLTELNEHAANLAQSA
ncbi:MAG: patatin-like phospholipase family protein [Xanthomonadales bacterium]|nr:patatin-like phospholipase family protein [Xanthomonadales bacterium]